MTGRSRRSSRSATNSQAEFGLDISDAQQNAILAMLAATVTLIMMLGPIIRTFVYSPHSTQELVNKAEEAGIKDAPAPVVQP